MPAILVSIRKFWISITLCILILFLCFMNVGNMSVASTGFDKLVHALMFLVVSGVVFFDNTRYFRQTATLRRIFSGSFLFPIFFGGIIEIGQRHATSYRSGDWIDFLFDVMGAVAGFLICLLINRCLKFPNRG